MRSSPPPPSTSPSSSYDDEHAIAAGIAIDVVAATMLISMYELHA
jgi:hypothetical protein